MARALQRKASTLLILLLLFAALWSWSGSSSSFVGAGRDSHHAAALAGRSQRSAVQRWASGLATASTKPVLYVYDHCPFCVRARMIFGFKEVPYHLIWMANDDVETPTALVQKKIAPILQLPGKGGSSAPEVMPESLDIVKRIDEGEEFGPSVLQPPSGRADLKGWSGKVSGIMRLLVRPRYPKGFFPEFATASAREAFMRNHPMPNPETGAAYGSDEWVRLGVEAWTEIYAKHFENTPKYLEELSKALPELETLIDSEESVSAGGVGYDDIIFWDRLRGTSLIKGLELGPRAQAYLERISAKSDIPLLTGMAM